MPFERVHLDLIEPMGNFEKGFKYGLVAIDVLTRYLKVQQLKSKETTEFAKLLLMQ